MTGFNDRFGGTQVQPADVAYRELDLITNLQTEWPPYATKDNVLAKTMNVLSAPAGVVIAMPDAREASPGETIIFYNSSTHSVLVTTIDNSTISNIEPGGRRMVLLTDNTTIGGLWTTTLLGVGTGTLDIAGAAGAGLMASGTTLNVAFPVIQVPAARDVTPGDRDVVLVWTGGTGALTLMSTSTVSKFNFEVRNQGTGALTLQPQGGELIDGVSNIILNNGESCWVHSGVGSWYTVGRGRNAQFNFTQLQKTVTGGVVQLTLTEAANVVQTYTGVLTSNCDIVFPSVVQVYYVSNQTTGAFNLRFKNAAAGGQTVSLPQGQNAVLFSDGFNVINAATTTAGTGQIQFAAGTASAPSVAIGDTNTGFYSPGTGSVNFTSGGSSVLSMSATGIEVSIAGNAVSGVTSTTANAFFKASRPAGAAGGLQVNTGTTPRWIASANSAAEGGGNLGSDFQLSRYDDAGVLIDSPLLVLRSTGVVVAKQVKDASLVGQICQFATSTDRPGFFRGAGQLVSRTAYPDLWVFAQGSGLVTEDQWFNQGYWGRFSIGDGSTNFRIPDLRGVFMRGLDEGRGFDADREWGKFQDQTVLSHAHGFYDPGHNHGVNDPSHAHNIADPGHSHSGWTDTQGWHGHGVSDPGHSHPYGVIGGNGVDYLGSGGNPAPNYRNTGGSGVGIGIAGDGNHTHNVGTGGVGTGIGIYGNGTGIYLSASGTGGQVQGAGSGDGHPRNQAYPYHIRY